MRLTLPLFSCAAPIRRGARDSRSRSRPQRSERAQPEIESLLFVFEQMTSNFYPSYAAVNSFPVAISEGSHPFPSRTRKLSPPEPMVLRGKPRGRVGRCRIFFESPVTSFEASRGLRLRVEACPTDSARRVRAGVASATWLCPSAETRAEGRICADRAVGALPPVAFSIASVERSRPSRVFCAAQPPARLTR